MVFTLTVEENGEWTFNLNDQLDHVANSGDDANDLLVNGGGSPSIEAIDFSAVVAVTDADGDELTLADLYDDGSSDPDAGVHGVGRERRAGRRVQHRWRRRPVARNSRSAVRCRKMRWGTPRRTRTTIHDPDLSIGNLDDPANDTDTAIGSGTTGPSGSALSLQVLVNDGADEDVTFGFLAKPVRCGQFGNVDRIAAGPDLERRRDQLSDRRQRPDRDGGWRAPGTNASCSR